MQTQSQQEKNLLRSFVRNINNFQLPNIPDFVFFGDSIYCFVHLGRKNIAGIQPNWKCTTVDCLYRSDLSMIPIELRSSKQNVLDQCFFMPSEQIESEQETILVQYTSHYYVCPSEGSDISEIWPEYTKNGHPVIAFEHVGLLSNSNSKCKRKPMVAACYPSRCSSHVQTPSEFVINIDQIKNYEPGILTMFVLSWFLFQKISGTQSVCIVVDPQTRREAMVIKAIFEKHKINFS